MDGRGGLRGRDGELAVLAEAVAAAAAGSGQVVVIRGDPGIGKSSLLAHLADLADRAGFDLRAGRGDEVGQGRPFGPIAQALGLRPDNPDPVAAGIGRILVGEEELDHTGLPMAAEVRFRVLDTVLALVDTITAHTPLTFVVDDAHWADDDTLRVIAALAERAGELPLIVAVGARLHPRGPLLTACLQSLEDHGARLVDVGPLAPGPMAELVGDLVDARPGDALLRDVARAGGNPFLAIELVTAHSAAGHLAARTGGVVELERGDDAHDLGDTVLGRLDHLRPETVEFLRAASVLGRTFALSVVATLLGRRGVEVVADVDEALAAGLLEPTGDRLSFSHDLVREGIYADLPASLRTTLHIEAARALAGARAEAFDVATQVERTAGTGADDDDAVGWLMTGARQVRVTAPATAASFLTRAAALLDPVDPAWLTVQSRLAEALVFSGRLRDGEALARECLARDDLEDADRRSLTYLLGQALFLQGRMGEAAAHFEHSARPGDPDHPAALADGALALLLSGELTAAAALADRARVAARDANDVAAETFVLAELSWIRALEGDLGAALDLGRRAVTRADGAGDLEAHRNVPYVFFAQVLLWADRDTEAMEAIDRADRLGERLGLVWDVPLRHLLRARAHHRGGQWDEAMAEVDAGLSHSHDQGGSIAEVWLWCVRARLTVARGDLDEAERSLVAAEAAAETSGQGADQIAWARGLLAEARGDQPTAALYLGLLWDGLEQRGLDYYVWDVAPDVVRVALRADDRDRVTRVRASLTEIVARSRDSSAPAVEARCRGLAERDPDALLTALDLIRERTADARPVELALVQMEAAAVLDGAGRGAEARSLRDLAGPVLAATRAVPPGVPGLDGTEGAPATDDPAGFGWASLTSRELDVLALLAQSLSNTEIAERLFCSRRTVESHLAHAYTKLGIASRVELAIEAARRFGTNP